MTGKEAIPLSMPKTTFNELENTRLAYENKQLHLRNLTIKFSGVNSKATDIIMPLHQLNE